MEEAGREQKSNGTVLVPLMDKHYMGFLTIRPVQDTMPSSGAGFLLPHPSTPPCIPPGPALSFLRHAPASSLGCRACSWGYSYSCWVGLPEAATLSRLEGLSHSQVKEQDQKGPAATQEAGVPGGGTGGGRSQ